MTEQALQENTASIDTAYWANVREYDELVAEFHKSSDPETRWRIWRRQEQLNKELETMP